MESDSITVQNNVHVKTDPDIASTTMTRPLKNIMQLLTIGQ